MIEYKVVERENPVTRQKTYFAQVAPVEPVTLEQVVKRIEKSSTVSSATEEAFLPSNIKRVRVQFSPSGTMLEEMALDRLSIHRMDEAPEEDADQEGGL